MVDPGNHPIPAGNGDGNFCGSPVTYPTGANSLGLPDSLVALDLNGDGLPDLAVANRNDSSVSTLPNAGGGKFKPAFPLRQLPYGTEYSGVCRLQS